MLVTNPKRLTPQLLAQMLMQRSPQPSTIAAASEAAPLVLPEESRRRGKKLQLKDVSEATDISQVALSRWMGERGMAWLDGVTTARLMKFFGCSLDDLVDVEEEDSSDPKNETRSTPNAA